MSKKKTLDDYMAGSSHELSLYISNQVLRGEIEKLRKELTDTYLRLREAQATIKELEEEND